MAGVKLGQGEHFLEGEAEAVGLAALTAERLVVVREVNLSAPEALYAPYVVVEF